MNRLTLDLGALRENLTTVSGWLGGRGASLTVVTKALCGHTEALAGLADLGVRSLADSRLENLEAVRDHAAGAETWYLRPPHRSALADVVALSDVSLNSELEVVKELDEEAARQGRIHRVVIMIELGDLREGILPGSLIRVYRQIFDLPNIEVVGIGANLGCLSGAVPSIDQLVQLALYRELLELKFEHPLPLISAGTSAILPLLLAGQLPRSVNHFRIGESILLGTDLVHGGTLAGLRDDVAVLEAEIVEIKEKSLVPLGEMGDVAPFAGLACEEPPCPGQRGFRALVTVGQVDTDVAGLTPVEPGFQIAGASSDITVLNVGEDRAGLSVGDTIRFRLGYSALVRAMANRYTAKQVVGRPFAPEQVVVPPVVAAPPPLQVTA